MPANTRNRNASKPGDRRVRLQKVLADAGVASRRACEKLIEEGLVWVNGEVVQGLPAFVDPASDVVQVEGRRVDTKRRHIHVMLFKPRGVVSTNRDPEGRRRAIDLVNHPSGERLYPVGRLDLDSSGLLLLTNDGDLANKLTHPRYGVHKGYEVTVRGRVDEEALEEISRGVVLADRGAEARRTQRSRVTIITRDRDRTMLYVELREGRNRQIRRVMASIGHPVKKLRRVAMGPVKLKGLGVGEWRELSPGELGALRRAARGVPTPEAKPRSKSSRGGARGDARGRTSSSGARGGSSRGGSSRGTSSRGGSGSRASGGARGRGRGR